MHQVLVRLHVEAENTTKWVDDANPRRGYVF